MESLNLANLARGALLEQFEYELQNVINNIADPNTDATKVRKIKIELKFKPNERRNLVKVNCQAQSALIPANSIETDIVLDKDSAGNIVAAELRGEIAGQAEIDYETGEILNETKVLKISK